MKGLKMSKCNNRVAFLENISYNSFISKVLDNLNKIRGSKAPAFTLTEVLLAVLIVGIIAALVLPAVVTKYQDKTFESAFNREVHSLQDSIDSLAAVENQQSFYETTLAKTPETYMKKYLRVSKYCGTSGKDCFGKFYSEYSDHEKKTYTPSYDGNCAILKNGTSVCLNVNGGNIAMLIDVNGPKGPNVWGRDLRTYTHSVKGKTGYDMSSNGIISLNQTPIEDNDTDPCEGKTCGCGDLPACDPCAGKTCGCGSLPACGVEVNAHFVLQCHDDGPWGKIECGLFMTGTNTNKLSGVSTSVTTMVDGAQSNGSWSNTYTDVIAADNKYHIICSGYDYSGSFDADGNPCPGSCPGGYFEEDWERCSLQYDPPYVVESKGKALCKIDSIGGNCNYKGTVK